jgi:hypothetical protein
MSFQHELFIIYPMVIGEFLFKNIGIPLFRDILLAREFK